MLAVFFPGRGLCFLEKGGSFCLSHVLAVFFPGRGLCFLEKRGPWISGRRSRRSRRRRNNSGFWPGPSPHAQGWNKPQGETPRSDQRDPNWEFKWISPGFLGQNRSKKNPQGRGSSLTKYGPTIYFLDPDHAPKTFRATQEIPIKMAFMFLGRVANNKSGPVASRFMGVAFTSESISSPSFLRTPKTVRNLP